MMSKASLAFLISPPSSFTYDNSRCDNLCVIDFAVAVAFRDRFDVMNPVWDVCAIDLLWSTEGRGESDGEQESYDMRRGLRLTSDDCTFRNLDSRCDSRTAVNLELSCSLLAVAK